MIEDSAITGTRRALGRRLSAYRRTAGLTQHQLATLTQYSRSSLANVETGRQSASREFWVLCDQIVNADGVLVGAYDEMDAFVRRQAHEVALSPGPAASYEPGGSDVGRRVARAAQESQTFLARWESRCLAPQTAEEFAEDLSRLATEYVYRPVTELFDDLVAVRDRAYDLLGEQRRTADTRGLLFAAGLACGLLAHASMDLGERRAAVHQARVAYRLAGEAGHQGLLAWVAGTQSLIAYCLGQPGKAVSLAERGRTAATSTGGSVRLTCLTARAYAAQGNAAAAGQALIEANRQRDLPEVRDELDDVGGVLVFDRAKQDYYAASTATLVADGRAAEAHADIAIDAYEHASDEQRSYGDLALARVCQAHGRLLRSQRHPDPAAAHEALRPVLDLPPSHRIAGLRRPLVRLHTALTQEPIRHAPEVRELRSEITDFLSGTPAITSA